MSESAEERYRAIFEASSDGLVVTDLETGRVLVANPAFCRMHGYDDMVGMEPARFVHLNSRHLIEQIDRTMREGGEFHGRTQHVRSDGSVFDVEVRARRFVYDGSPAVLEVVRDVSESVRTHQQLERLVADRTYEIEQRRRVAEALRDLVAVVNSNQTLDQILREVLAQARRLLGTDAEAIYLSDARGQPADILQVHAAHGLEPAMVATHLRVGVPVTGLSVLEQRPTACTDLVAALDDALGPEQTELVDRGRYVEVRRMGPRLAPELDDDSSPRVRRLVDGFRAVLAVPLRTRNRVYGAVSLYFSAPRRFSDEEVELASAFGDQAALAIENARLQSEADQRLRQLEALYRADEALHRSLRLDHVLQSLVGAAGDLLQAEKASVWIWDEERQKLVVGAARGLSDATMSAALGPEDLQVLREPPDGAVSVVEDYASDPRVGSRLRAISERERLGASMTAVIRIQGRVFGLFVIGFSAPRSFHDEETRLLLALAQRAALAIENARLYEHAQQAGGLEERQRLARELHDAVSQTLFSASLLADVLPRLWERNPDEARRRLGELRQLTRGALAEMRTLLLELRPAALVESSLDVLLQQLADALTGRSQIVAEVRVVGEPRILPADVQVTLYRLAQEALNNAAKHARAQRTWVDLAWLPTAVSLRIEDDGCGFDLEAIPPGHLGVQIMYERAASVGAAVEISSCLGGGTRVQVTWTDPRTPAEPDVG